jgi:2-polyprenyl-6-hydroxyphenyl methylase/3-demethylubiquinone-9 3-methyltransferase
MNKSSQIRDPFVDYYEQQSSSPQTIAQFEKLKNSLLRILGRPSGAEGVRVLDIGCGAGTFSRIWASQGAFVRGVDVNDALVEIAKERAQSAGLSIEFVVGTATSLPWADRSVDVVVMPELLEHVSEWRCCLEEAVRVLDEGGVLYLSTSNRLCPKQDEFSLPMYSWYPEVIKRRCLERARTDRRHWVRHAEFPALHWFDAYQLAKVFRDLGMEPYDRFQIWSRYSPSASRRVIGRVAEALPPVRLIGHVLTSYTRMVGKKISR